MFAAITELSESQVINLCVIVTILTVYPLVAVAVALLGVLHRKSPSPNP
jgi:hypothetical protein